MWVQLCVTWLGYEADFTHANLIALPAASGSNYLYNNTPLPQVSASDSITLHTSNYSLHCRFYFDLLNNLDIIITVIS